MTLDNFEMKEAVKAFDKTLSLKASKQRIHDLETNLREDFCRKMDMRQAIFELEQKSEAREKDARELMQRLDST